MTTSRAALDKRPQLHVYWGRSGKVAGQKLSGDNSQGLGVGRCAAHRPLWFVLGSKSPPTGGEVVASGGQL